MAHDPTPTSSEVLRPDSPGRWFVRLLKGIAVGVGAILPGLSGGVLAVIFKLYDPLIRFLANIRRNFVKNVMYFIPVGIGVAIGIFAFSVLVKAAFDSYAAQFICLFIGFVVGTFPSLYRTAGKHGRTVAHLITMVIAAVLIFALMLAGEQTLVQVEPSIPVWIGSGALIGLGVIVPGMSPSNFLIYFGLYDKMAGGIKELDFAVIIPLFIGVVLCVLLLAKGAAWLFDRYYAHAFHFILGMVIGSSVALFPTQVFPAFTSEQLAAHGLTMTTGILFAVAMLIVGTVASYLFSRVEDKYSDEREAIDNVTDDGDENPIEVAAKQ
ncbi:MAG TPA: DUF368 domain-containing protein [Tessaracoccus flavescens]|uniref:DUF368 domain-containing protein n=1 Tax=Tessaracoccus flavescens TaxID=399497 RepID=A0A921EQ20_9ACTN|nr:DUF368 domain-containing protein [Tessaracoccus flavescens]